jgi:hypothetical protein
MIATLIIATTVYAVAWVSGFVSGRIYEMEKYTKELEVEKASKINSLYPPKQ